MGCRYMSKPNKVPAKKKNGENDFYADSIEPTSTSIKNLNLEPSSGIS